MKPRLEFGAGILGTMSRGWEDFLVVTMPEVWKTAGPMLARPPKQVWFVSSMDRGEVEKAEAGLPDFANVVGIGGGMVMDLAKYIAWKRGRAPVLVPSIASVDACVTNAIAVRDQGKVHYLGFVVPQVVISDFALMKSAPANLNRAGIGDILSIHTGRFDWNLAADRGQAEYNEAVGRQVSRLVDELEDHAEDIREVTDRGLRWLIEAYAAENALCLQVGNSRPEEGSEHFFAYNLEHQTRRSFVHGELVCLGVLLMSRLQKNQPGRVQTILENTGVRFQPLDLKISITEMNNCLSILRSYVESEGLFYSIINEAGFNPELIKELSRNLGF